MKIITGQVARKDSFWDRKEELEDIWYKINNGSHILLVAPRRVGKTSIMYKIMDTPQEETIVLYVDVESADRENEFWKKLFSRLTEEEFLNTLKTKANKFLTFLRKINIDEITTKGIKFGETLETNYAEAFKRVIKNLDTDKKLIFMIDEFAQSIENIIKHEGEREAQHLLKTHRELRQDQILSEKIIFIYAGSIGLESVAAKIESIATINDLAVVKVLPLGFDDAKMFIEALAISNAIDIDSNVIDYLLEKIEWLIPFYIQLIMDELRKARELVTEQTIDKAFQAILDNKNHFDHWRSRLQILADNEYRFAKEVLSIISENTTMQSNEIINIATKHGLSEDDAKEVIRSLVYDGYINNNDNPREYRFNSPILRMWWSKNVAN